MSVQDETWDRPRCNICCTDIKFGEKKLHGAGRCDSDAAHSKRERTGLQCPHCYQMVKYEDKAKHDGGKCNEICINCGSPVHPCLPCEEVVMLNGNHTDDAYSDLLKLILREGRIKRNRTGVNTIGVFGAQAKFDVRMDAFPILTTKKVWFKGIVHELLWFISGDTNIKYLVDNDVHIWDEWAYKRYNDHYTKFGYPKQVGDDYDKTHARELECDGDALFTQYSQERFIYRIKNDNAFAQKWGELGEGTYGGMWRAFPYYYEGHEHDDSYDAEGHVDQLKKVIDKLKTNPDDRRMIVSAWHPYWIDHCALPPCHCLFHFNTEELTQAERWDMISKYNWEPMGGRDKKGCHKAQFHKDDPKLDEDMDSIGVPRRRLNLLLYQRSCDTAIGIPYNITSYALLLAMVSQCVGMEPGVFTHTYGDLHIYENHLDGVKKQLLRTPKILPKLWLNPEIKDLFSFKYEDIKLVNYISHPKIEFQIAV